MTTATEQRLSPGSPPDTFAPAPPEQTSPMSSPRGVYNRAPDSPVSTGTGSGPGSAAHSKRSSRASIRRKSVPNSIESHHERYSSTDSTAPPAKNSSIAQTYQAQLPRFSGRVTSMQSTDSRNLQTPSPDLMMRGDDDPPVLPPLHSPSFRPQHVSNDGYFPQPQMAVISSGETDRSSKDSYALGSLNIDTEAPLSDASTEEDKPQKLYPQLQYHHEQFVEGPDGQLRQVIGKRPLTEEEKQPNREEDSSTPSSDGQRKSGLLAPGNATRQNSRPASTYSTSDSRGRSPSNGSPYQRGSTNSYDSRRSSYLDLTLPAHVTEQGRPVSTLDNTGLREHVGENANLLSQKQTLEMYRANAKKTQDPMLQYELAVFMINAAQQMQGEVSVNSSSPRLSSAASRDNSTDAPESPGTASKKELLREARGILQTLSNRLPQAQYYLADAFASGLFNKGKEEWERAFPLFVAASKHGHAEAGYRAALCYEFGWGCRKDPSKAVQFYRQAAAKSHPGAMTRLGLACLRNDLGLQRAYKEGVKWLKRATDVADEQYPQAPYELGCLHETGFGDDVFEDASYAAQLFTQAAELGHADAHYRMGDAYEHGRLNCPRDAALSVHFYTGAAQLRHPLAMMALCAWYLVGAEPVLEKNEGEAYQWALKATDYGLPKAEYAVGYFTEMGMGCRPDSLEANVWYVKAADHGDERAVARLKIIHEAAGGGPSPTKKTARKASAGKLPEMNNKPERRPSSSGKLEKQRSGEKTGENGKECVIM